MRFGHVQLWLAAAAALRTSALRGLAWAPRTAQRSALKVLHRQLHLALPLRGGALARGSATADGATADEAAAVGLAPIVICGPSGVGKGTLLARLFQACGDRSGYAVSHTTRAARPGEAEGKDYFFTDRASMLAAVARGEFLEHVEVHGNKYGTSYAAVRSVVDGGKVCVLDLDCQGVREIMERPRPGFAPLFVFVRPPSVEVLQLRLERRNTETASQIAGRVTTARGELLWAAGEAGDFGRFDGLVENADLDEATRALFELVARWHPHLAPRLQFPVAEAAADAPHVATPTIVGAQILR